MYDDEWLTMKSLTHQIEVALRETKLRMQSPRSPTPIDDQSQTALSPAQRKRRRPRKVAVRVTISPIYCS